MATPKDQQRIQAFRDWVASFPSSDDARAQLPNLNARTYSRFMKGLKPPPPALLETIADRLDDPMLADQLRRAALGMPS